MGRLGSLIYATILVAAVLLGVAWIAPEHRLAEILARADRLVDMGVSGGAVSQADAALTDLQEALRIHPGHPRALLGLARVHRAVGDLDSALPAYAEAIRAAAAPEARREIGKEAVKAMVARLEARLPRDGDEEDGWALHDEAVRWLLAIAEVIPADDEVLQAVGDMLLTAGAYPEAEPYLRRALDGAPEGAHALNNLAWLYLTAREDEFRRPAEALPLARKAVDLEPDDPGIIHTLAEACYQTGAFDEAVRLAEKAQKIQTQDGRLKRRLEKDLERFRQAAGR